MTNGEKFKQIFPNIQIDMGEIYIYVWIDHEPAHITKEWWSAEYKEPTTKNCESCRYYGSHHEVCNYCYKCSLWTEGDPTTETEHWVNIKNCIDGKCDDCNVCNTPTNKNDSGVDCVSRQEVDRLARIYLKEPTDNHVAFYEDFLELPPVTPQEPRKGQWYRHTNDYVDYYECSKCGMAMSLYDIKHYCPNCGSRNEVEK